MTSISYIIKTMLLNNVFFRYLVLFLLSLIVSLLLLFIHFPAPFLIGSLFMGILFSVLGYSARIHNAVFFSSLSIVGAMIAGRLPSNLSTEVLKDWPIFLIGTVVSILISNIIGVFLYKIKILPGSTAIWGISPGASNVMVMMSEAYDADMRLVAFMQYLRVVCCVIAAALFTHLLPDFEVHNKRDIFEGIISYKNFFSTIFVGLFATYIGIRFKIPAGGLLPPLLSVYLLKSAGVISFELPNEILVVAYMIVGLSIGLRFTRDALIYVKKTFLPVFISILVLILLNVVFAIFLTILTEIDLLTAVLATSPGGADSVGIIAANTNADISFIMAMQVTRLFLVILFCPIIARLLTKNIK